MDVKLIIGIIAGILTSVSSIPQIVKILKEKKVAAVSPMMFFVLLGGNALWCWYGVILGELPIIVTNAFSVICDITAIFLNYRYSKKSSTTDD